MSNERAWDRNRGYRHPFINGIHFLGGVGDAPRTLVDLAMTMFSAEIRRSPGWWIHIKDEDTRLGWMKHGLERSWPVKTPSQVIETNLLRRQVTYVLDELEGYSALRDEAGKCQVSCFERIWESDSLLDTVTSQRFCNVLRNLKSSATENVGSLEYIIDHRLYPLIYNTTLVSDVSGGLVPINPPSATDSYTVSKRFAFLPSDVSVLEDASSLKFTSYINNLHPEFHRDVYPLLEKLLGGFLPLFERTLTDLHRINPLMQRIPGRYRYTVWDEPEPPEHSDDEEGWVNYEKDMRQWVLNRPISVPDVPQGGYSGGMEIRNHVVRLQNRNLQFVVSAAEILLTSKSPVYEGDPWRIEGMKNDRIVAVGCHCLSVDNITGASVEFRMAVTSPRGFNAGDSGATLRTWGIRDGDSCHQYIGEVPLRSGLSLVFPNVYQHSQTPFRLTDNSKDGHLTLIWFFLIDPEVEPVISTSRVGPQQKSWLLKALDDYLDKRLPHEVMEKILNFVEGVMTLEEAEEYKKEMLKECAEFTQANNSYHFCIPFDVWNGPEVIH